MLAAISLPDCAAALASNFSSNFFRAAVGRETFEPEVRTVVDDFNRAMLPEELRKIFDAADALNHAALRHGAQAGQAVNSAFKWVGQKLG